MYKGIRRLLQFKYTLYAIEFIWPICKVNYWYIIEFIIC